MIANSGQWGFERYATRQSVNSTENRRSQRHQESEDVQPEKEAGVPNHPPEYLSRLLAVPAAAAVSSALVGLLQLPSQQTTRATCQMADEADSGTSNTATALYPPEPLSTNEDPDNENEKVSASNSNYDSNDGTTPLFRCERCDKFETHSQPMLLVHYVQCNLNNNNASAISKQDNDDNELDNSLGSATVSESEKQQPSRKLFECDVCNMKFSNGANMRRHKMRHTGVKPYECRVCQKRFFRKDHLAEHFTTHTKTLPYHCPICNRGFQRQIAMRAHFQNEHVGQHDLVKTCPLCSFRAGTMKSLRVHFFNRHGIDLDNPGPSGPSSLLLALEPQNAAHYMPSLSTTAPAPSYSDSGDSLRSADNATPPMHFLTPHVEISMAENADSFNSETGTTKLPNSTLDIQPSNGPCGGSPSSPQSADSNSNIPSSSHTLASLVQSPRANHSEGHITPSISLIPIKQEPTSEDYSENKNGIANSSDQISMSSGVTTNSQDSTTPTSSLTSLIKVSPLKSLLREDLKRRICARASTRITRSNGGANINSSSAATSPETASCNSATTSNGVITSTGQEGDLLALNRKKQLQCLFCGIEFPDQTLYFLHKGCHSESNPWKCNICGEQCNNVYEFNSHLLSKSHQ